MATAIPENVAGFSFEEVLEITSGKALLVSAAPVVGVTCDSRGDLTGKAFVALRGERFDGHDFLVQAVAGGARLLIVRDERQVHELLGALLRSVPGPDGGGRLPGIIAVSDPLAALGQLASAHRQRWPGRLVAVAGSAGKTTTRSAISALLQESHPGQVHSTRGNLNNLIGVPMTLLGLCPQHRFAVVEVGTNRPSEVQTLARIVHPDVAVLTLIDWEHSEGLGGLDAIEAEERAIFCTLGEGQAALGFGDDPRVARSVLASRAEHRLFYGEAPSSDLCIASRRALRPDAAELRVRRRDGSELSFSTSLIGKPGALASAAAVLAVETLTGRPCAEAQCTRALANAGEPGRHTVVELEGPLYIIDDSYNSNPASVESSIGTGREMADQVGGRLWLVLGEMLELGPETRSAHQRMGQAARESSAVGACFVGGDATLAAAQARGGPMEVTFFEHSQEVAAYLGPLLRARDVVVLKGSRGVRVERVLEGLTKMAPPRAADPGAPADRVHPPGGSNS